MKQIEKVISWVALGLAIVALVVGSQGKSGGVAFGVPNVNCNGASYCTAFTGLLFTSATSTGTFSASGLVTAQSILATGTLAVGSNVAAQQITILGAATSTSPNLVLSPITVASSSATSTITIPVAGLALGDPCIAGLATSTVSQAGFGIDANITSSTASVATATITYWNGSNATTTIQAATVRVLCTHLGI